MKIKLSKKDIEKLKDELGIIIQSIDGYPYLFALEITALSCYVQIRTQLEKANKKLQKNGKQLK